MFELRKFVEALLFELLRAHRLGLLCHHLDGADQAVAQVPWKLGPCEPCSRALIDLLQLLRHHGRRLYWGVVPNEEVALLRRHGEVRDNGDFHVFRCGLFRCLQAGGRVLLPLAKDTEREFELLHAGLKTLPLLDVRRRVASWRGSICSA